MLAAKVQSQLNDNSKRLTDRSDALNTAVRGSTVGPSIKMTVKLVGATSLHVASDGKKENNPHNERQRHVTRKLASQTCNLSSKHANLVDRSSKRMPRSSRHATKACTARILPKRMSCDSGPTRIINLWGSSKSKPPATKIWNRTETI